MSPEERAEEILLDRAMRSDVSILVDAVEALARELDVEARHIASEVAAMIHKAANVHRLRRDTGLGMLE
jgi:hypothetical protein